MTTLASFQVGGDWHKDYPIVFSDGGSGSNLFDGPDGLGRFRVYVWGGGSL
jgi:hypothetical protein